MLSIHANKARRKADSLGAFSGRGQYRDLYDCSKRELIEMLIHIAAQTCAVGYETAINGLEAKERIKEEYDNLKAQKLL